MQRSETIVCNDLLKKGIGMEVLCILLLVPVSRSSKLERVMAKEGADY